MTQLPGIAGEIEGVIGLDLAVVLLRARGGTEITLPQPVPGSHLEQLVGGEAAEAMVEYFGAGRLRLPLASMRGVARYNAERRARAIDLLRAGESAMSVALACDLNLRTVHRYRAEMEAVACARQGKLDI